MIRLSLSLLLALVAAAEPADWIFSARWVVTMDPARRVIGEGAVAVRGERIVAVGPRSEIERRFDARNRIDAPDTILTPGLINTHTHAPMALFRGVADDLRLQDWLEKYIFPAEAKNVSPEFVRDGTNLACLEMLLGGTTTYVDMYYFEEEIAAATVACGMRAVLGQTIIGFPVADAKTPSEGLRRAEAFIARYAKDPLIVPAVAPHALYTNSEDTLRQARALANRHGVPLLIHLSETKKENDDMQKKYGGSPTAILDRWGILTGRTVAAHGVWITSEDIEILRRRSTGVAHCPSSNMKLASGIAPVVQLMRAGVPIGIGTDGPAGSNNDLNLFEEMDLAAKLQKVHTSDPTVLSAQEAFEKATIGGAHAIGLSKEIGSLEAGKRADLTFTRISEPHGQPLFQVYSHLVYALKASDVRHVVVNGKVVVKDRSVLTLNQADILKAASAWKDRISASVATPRP